MWTLKQYAHSKVCCLLHILFSQGENGREESRWNKVHFNSKIILIQESRIYRPLYLIQANKNFIIWISNVKKLNSERQFLRLKVQFKCFIFIFILQMVFIILREKWWNLLHLLFTLESLVSCPFCPWSLVSPSWQGHCSGQLWEWGGGDTGGTLHMLADMGL